MAIDYDQLIEGLKLLQRFVRGRGLRLRRQIARKTRRLPRKLDAPTLAEKLERYQAMVEEKGRIVPLPCTYCGTYSEIDVPSVMAAAMYTLSDPDAYVMCPACSASRELTKRLRRAVKKTHWEKKK